MDNLITFRGRQQPPPPPRRTPRVRALGCRLGGGMSGVPLAILTGHKDELSPTDGLGDSIIPWAYIASRRWAVTYDKGVMPPYNANAATDI
jgi:hypothetical protein